MRISLPLTVLFFCCGEIACAQFDNVGSGRAIRFDGVNDYINLGDVYDNITFPISVEFWVKADPAVSLAPIFVSQDNLPLYNGFWIGLTATNVFLEIGDGRGENSSAFRRGISTNVSGLHGRWVHIAGVWESSTRFSLYLNGVKAAAFNTGNSTSPMASNYPEDHAKIGTWLSNGLNQYFKGELDEVRVWNKELSQDEIRSRMCSKLTGQESGLVGWWSFDETGGDIVFDKSHRGYDGVMSGKPTRVFSGAPIGDESVHDYGSSWNGVSLSLGDFKVAEIQNSPQGVHIYRVNSNPSQTSGLEGGSLTQPYYGVFVARNQTVPGFTVEYGSGHCASYVRDSNADPSWVEGSVLEFSSDQLEFLPLLIADVPDFDLGEDVVICDGSPYEIKSGLDENMVDFEWNNGSTGSSIIVTTSGEYILKISNTCGFSKDTIHVNFAQPPPTFSLGEDRFLCEGKTLELTSDVEVSDYETIWNDGTSSPTNKVKKEGVYWLTVRNECGETYDEVNVKEVKIDVTTIPNVITPNGDRWNEYFILPRFPEGVELFVFNRWGRLLMHNPIYQNDWSGKDLPTGVYFWRVLGGCPDDLKGTITIVH